MKSVADILKSKGGQVHSVVRDATVLDAALAMNQARVGAVIVNDGDRVIGIFTERDVLCRVVAARRDPAGTRVGEVMTSPVACCTSATLLDECRRVMREKRIRHIPVVDDGRLRGMISIGDLNEFELGEQDETIRYLHDYMHGRT